MQKTFMLNWYNFYIFLKKKIWLDTQIDSEQTVHILAKILDCCSCYHNNHYKKYCFQKKHAMTKYSTSKFKYKLP